MANGEVKLNSARLKELARFYGTAIKQIEGEFRGATDFGLARRKAILANVRGALIQLKTQMDDWASVEIPSYYRDGINDAIKGLDKIGIAAGTDQFTLVDRMAVQALVSDVQEGFAVSLEGVLRSSKRVLSVAEKEEIKQTLAQGVLTGEEQKRVAAQVKGVLQESGITSLTDKGGRNWDLDNYTQMLVRTKAVEARNTGLGNRMAENGFDLVQVSNHGSTHPECAAWEGEILSYTGKTPGYPTVADATAAGLFHPNCQHAINVITPELANKTNAYDNPYNR